MGKQRRRRVDQLAQIKEPKKVKVLILTEQKASIKDFFFIRNFTQIKKMDLSYNKLASFPVGFSFRSFLQLRILYLHYNKFNNLKSIQPLAECRCLQYLTMFGNSLQQTKTRHLMVNDIPSLKLMDDKVVKAQERASDLFDQSTVVIKLNFPLVSNIQSDDSSAFLAAVIQELYLVRKYYIQANPIIKIQRYWKMKLLKNQNKNKKQIKAVLQQELLYPMDSNELLQRPTTKKLQIYKSNQEKVISVLAMNLQFWTYIKKLAQGKVFAVKKHCIQNKIPFTSFSEYLSNHKYSYVGLRTPQKSCQKSFLPFFIQTASMFTIRKLNKQNYNNTANKLLLKGIPRKIQKKCFSLSQQQKVQLHQASLKIQKLQQIYLSSIVIINLPPKQIFGIIKSTYITLNNKNKSNKFPFCFQHIIGRSISAIAIQRAWRGYKSRKLVKIRQAILENRSALKIQRWIRNLGFTHRRKFLLYIKQYLKKQNSKSIIVSSKIIQQIGQFRRRITHYRNLLIPFQKSQIFISKQFDNGQYINKIKIKAQRDPFPKFFGQLLSIETKPSYQLCQSNQDMMFEDILFRNCKSIDYISDKRHQKDECLKQNYIQFHYNSIQEARNRKFLLALKTYSMKKHQFVKSIDIQHRRANTAARCINQSIKQQYVIASNSLTMTLQLSSLNWKKVKIRYFNGKDDHSCLLKIASMDPAQFLGFLNPIQVPRKLQSQRRKPQPKITRSYLVLQDLSVRKASPKSYRYYEEEQRLRQLLTDNSKTTILLQNRGQAFRLHDASQQTIGVKSLISSIQQELQSKKSRANEIKQSHKERIATLSINRNENLQKLRSSIAASNQMNTKMIEQKKEIDYIEKLKKYKRVRDNLRKSQESFQNEFSARGNRAVKIQLLKFEKRMHQIKNGKNQSSLNHQSPLLDSLGHSKLKVETKKKRTHNPINKSLTTQIRQFSIADSNNDGLFKMDSLNQASTSRNKDPRKMSQKIHQQIRQEEIYKQMQLIQNHKKSSKMKKLIHSVFPEQCYPLQEDKKIGFELPKLKLKK